MAHRGVCGSGEIDTLIEENQKLVRRRAQEIFELVDRPMTASEIDQAACARYELYTRKNRRALRFERNIRFFVEYLVDTGQLEMSCQRGVVLYSRPKA